MRQANVRHHRSRRNSRNRCSAALHEGISASINTIGSADKETAYVTAPSEHGVAHLLLNAQEEERGRIGRELHDGIGQEVALLIAKLRLTAQSRDLNDETAAELWQLSGEAQKIGNAIRGLSHDLYPAKLEYLGLSVAAESFCREFSRSYDIVVTCTCRNISRTLDRTVALSLYRIMQEALHNVVKHSGARHARVELAGNRYDTTLAVTDTGKGFDVEDHDRRLGLGILSMTERVHALNGTILVNSKLGEGTRIEVRIPHRHVQFKPSVEEFITTAQARPMKEAHL